MIFHSYVNFYQRVAIPSLGGMSRGPSRAWTQTCAAMGNHRVEVELRKINGKLPGAFYVGWLDVLLGVAGMSTSDDCWIIPENSLRLAQVRKIWRING